MRKMIFYGIVLGLWLFLLWASVHSFFHDDSLFFRAEHLNAGHYLLAFLFRLFRKPFLFILPSVLIFFAWGIGLYWVWFKEGRFWGKFFRLIQLLLIALLLFVVTSVQWARGVFVQPFYLLPFEQQALQRIVYGMMFVVVPVLLISELVLLWLEKKRLSLRAIFGHWLQGLFFVLMGTVVMLVGFAFFG